RLEITFSRITDAGEAFFDLVVGAQAGRGRARSKQRRTPAPLLQRLDLRYPNPSDRHYTSSPPGWEEAPKSQYWKLICRAPHSEPPQTSIDPKLCDLLLDAVLFQTRPQSCEIHPIERLVLIRARKHDLLLASQRIAMQLQALRTDLLHHALHGRIDAANRLM